MTEIKGADLSPHYLPTHLEEKKTHKCSKTTLLSEIESVKQKEEPQWGILRRFLEDRYKKATIKARVKVQHQARFQTAWDGARTLLKIIDKERNERAQKADKTLLQKDLGVLKNILE